VKSKRRSFDLGFVCFVGNIETQNVGYDPASPILGLGINSEIARADACFDFSEDGIRRNVFGARRHSAGRCNLGDPGFAPRHEDRSCPDGQRLLIFDVEVATCIC
jgi:hypothetical protein